MSTEESPQPAVKLTFKEHLATKKPSREERKAKAAAYVATHADAIAAQRAKAQASTVKRVQQLSTARTRTGLPQRVPVGSTPFDIYKQRARAHTASIKERITAATTKRSVINARSPAHV